MEELLKIQDIHVYYGKSHALHGISIDVKQGEIVTLLGANGAGKTTTLCTVSGLVKPTKGTIHFNQKDITKLGPDKIVEMGLIHVPQGRKVFPRMTVYENLDMGSISRNDKNKIQEDLEMVYSLFPILFERKKQLAGTLSGGEQQMLAVGRALMSNPKLLMMDEPSMGLAPVIVAEVYKKIDEIKKAGITILLVEQNAGIALDVSDRAYILDTGNIVLHGYTKDIEKNEIVKAYLI